MKKYLNQQERITFLYMTNLMDRTENMIEDWDQRGNLTKEERKYLKMSLSFGLKAFESILHRLDKSVVAALKKEKDRSGIHLDMVHSLEIIKKRKKAELDASYEENKEYYRLVELILDSKCQGCRIPCGECEIFEEFQKQCVPYADGNEEFSNCKYSY